VNEGGISLGDFSGGAVAEIATDDHRISG